MTEQEGLDFCRQWLPAWTGNDPEKLWSFYAEGAFYRDPARPEGLSGPDLLTYFRKLLAQNPDWKWEALEVIPTGKGFCLKWRATLPVKGKTIHETGLDIVELTGGKITRNEVYFDRAPLFKAMG